MRFKNSISRERFKDRASLRWVKAVRLIQDAFIDRLINEILGLDIESGQLKTNSKNYRFVSIIDSLYAGYVISELLKLANTLVEDIAELANLNQKYFNEAIDNQADYEPLKSTILTAVLVTLGYNWVRKKLVDNGPLMSILGNTSPSEEFKNRLAYGIATEQKVDIIQRQFDDLKGLRGPVLKQIETRIPQPHDQSDRFIANQFAHELQLQHAIYQGGVIKNTRDFCRHRNDEVFTRAEIMLFGSKKDSYGGYTNKTKGEFQGKWPTGEEYDPIRDLGGINCRHQLDWISQELAERLRPDLKKGKAA